MVKYTVVQELSEEKHYSIRWLYQKVGIGRASYYKWLSRDKSQLELENEELLTVIKELNQKHNGTLGCKRMTMYINKNSPVRYNRKRIRRLMRFANIKCVIRRKRPNYIKSTVQFTAENLLNRDFSATHLNEKWLTNVTEFKYGHSGEKAYLSAILDLKDRHIVSYVLGPSNNNPLVFQTIDQAIALNPSAQPLLHSDRGFQYTNRVFKAKLDAAGMTQSMSRIGRCIHNGPMEGFWGILKSEMYYLQAV